MQHLGKTLFLCTSLVALPAAAQDRAGKSTRLELLQRVETVRNPDLNPGQDDTETVSTTRLAYTIKSKTHRDDLSLRLNAALRLPLSSSDSSDAELDEAGATLRYVHTAPGVRFSTYAAVQRRELSRLNAFDLVDDDSIIGDIDDLDGSGTRTNANIRIDAQFRDDRPFSWGVTLGASRVRYTSLSAGSTLENADSYTAALNGSFDLSSTTQLTTRVSYIQSEEDNSARTKTYGADFGLVVSRPSSELRGSISFAWPDQSADRVAITVGHTRELSETSQISFDVGGSFENGGETSLVGRFGYQKLLPGGHQIQAQLDRVVQDSTDGSAFLRTTGQVGYMIPLGPLTGLNFDARYLERDTIGSNDELSEYGISASINRQLTSDWVLQVGLSHTSQDETGNATATSDAVFFTLQRAWDGKF